jgi:hypothetical protein
MEFIYHDKSFIGGFSLEVKNSNGDKLYISSCDFTEGVEINFNGEEITNSNQHDICKYLMIMNFNEKNQGSVLK